MRRILAISALTALVSLSAYAVEIGPPCACDCDLDGRIEVSELVLLINHNLNGSADLDACPGYLGNPGLPISVSSLVGCILGLIHNQICPTPLPTDTPTITPTPLPTATPTEIFPPTNAAASAAATALFESIRVCGTLGTPGGAIYIQPEPAGARHDCESFTGHNGYFTLLRYPSIEEARAAFGQPAPDEEVSDTGGGTLREHKWVPGCCSGGTSTQWTWQRRCWVAGGSTFDDTHYNLTPRGPSVIRAFVESGMLEDLIALCD